MHYAADGPHGRGKRLLDEAHQLAGNNTLHNEQQTGKSLLVVAKSQLETKTPNQRCICQDVNLQCDTCSIDQFENLVLSIDGDVMASG